MVNGGVSPRQHKRRGCDDCYRYRLRHRCPHLSLGTLALCLGIFQMVPRRGLEPPRGCPHMDLNHARLPIPPPRHEGRAKIPNPVGSVNSSGGFARRLTRSRGLRSVSPAGEPEDPRCETVGLRAQAVRWASLWVDIWADIWVGVRLRNLIGAILRRPVQFTTPIL